MKRRKSIDTFLEGKWTQKTKTNFSIVVERLRMLAASVDDAWKDGISDRMEDD